MYAKARVSLAACHACYGQTLHQGSVQPLACICMARQNVRSVGGDRMGRCLQDTIVQATAHQGHCWLHVLLRAASWSMTAKVQAEPCMVQAPQEANPEPAGRPQMPVSEARGVTDKPSAPGLPGEWCGKTQLGYMACHMFLSPGVTALWNGWERHVYMPAKLWGSSPLPSASAWHCPGIAPAPGPGDEWGEPCRGGRSWASCTRGGQAGLLTSAAANAAGVSSTHSSGRAPAADPAGAPSVPQP